MSKARYHLVTLVQDTFPGVKDTDLFIHMGNNTDLDKQYQDVKIIHEQDGTTKLDDIFTELDVAFPAFSIQPKAIRKSNWPEGSSSHSKQEVTSIDVLYYTVLQQPNTWH